MSDEIHRQIRNDRRKNSEELRHIICAKCAHYSDNGASQNNCRARNVLVAFDHSCAFWKPNEKTGTPTPTDPKGPAGAAKAPLHLLPPSFLEATAKVLALGARKYGPWNWRNAGSKLECQTYVAAIMRHISAYQDGEDAEQESGESHIAHIAASCAILIDAAKHGTLHDNRPPKQQ